MSDRAEYWRDVAERVVRGFAQGMIAGLIIGDATFDKGGWPWLDAFYLGVGVAVLALLFSLAGVKAGDPRSGSWRTPRPPVNKPTPDLIERVAPKEETGGQEG